MWVRLRHPRPSGLRARLRKPTWCLIRCEQVSFLAQAAHLISLFLLSVNQEQLLSAPFGCLPRLASSRLAKRLSMTGVSHVHFGTSECCTTVTICMSVVARRFSCLLRQAAIKPTQHEWGRMVCSSIRRIKTINTDPCSCSAFPRVGAINR